MEYRIARKDDLLGLLSLYKQLNPEEEIIDLEKAYWVWDATEKTNATRYFVAVDTTRIVSTCNITLVPNLTRHGKPFAIIENVITDNDYRRRGIGKKVIENAVQYAKENNCYKVVLLSSMRRIESHEFYESIGFNGSSKKGFEIRF
ncbi:MAG TPA: GNAT family N-acetyltransferase [Anaerolineales bacterium]|nr:GNAT family N-acetyltransferase [Anaerolineales bacterium]